MSHLRQIPEVGDPVVTKMVERLVEAYRPEQMILFGSVARGDAGPDSDYDPMIIVPDDAKPERQRSRIGFRALRDLGMARDLPVSKASDFRRQFHRRASFPSAILREGIVLYEA